MIKKLSVVIFSLVALTLFTSTAEAVKPTTTTNPATSITTNSALLNGTANPNGRATTGWFRYSKTSVANCNDTFGTRAPSSGGTALGSGNTSVPFSRSISGLSANTKYYFCAISSNSSGKSFGTVLNFTTPAAIAKPMITNVDPTSQLLTAGGQLITITGTNLLVGTNGAKVDNAFVTTSGTSTSVTFTSPAHAAGTVSLRAYSPGGNDSNGGYWDWVSFNYQDPIPQIASVSGNTTQTTAGGLSVTITGIKFQPNTLVKVGFGSFINDVPAQVTYISPTELSIIAPAMPAGTYGIGVWTPNGSGSFKNNVITYTP